MPKIGIPQFLVAGASGDGFIRKVAVLTTGTAASRVVLLLALPVVSRLFSPDQVGLWQLFISVFLTIQPLFTWEYSRAVVLPDRDEDAADVFGLALTVTLVMAAILLVTASLWRDEPASWLHAPTLAPYFWIVPVVAVWMGIEADCFHWLARQNRFTGISASVLLRSTVMVAVPIGAAAFGWVDAGALIVGSVAGYGASGLFLAGLTFRKNGVRPWRRYSAASLWKQAATYRNYPLYVAPYGFIGEAGNRLRFFLLGAFVSHQAVGYFAFAAQIAMAPVFVAGEMRTVFFTKASRERDREALGRFVLRVLRLTVYGSAPAAAYFMIHGAYLLNVFLSDRWAEAGTYAVLLAAPAFLLLNVSWLDRMYDVTGRQRLAVILQILYDLVSICAFAAVLALGRGAFAAVAVYSAISAVYWAAWLAITFHVAGFRLAGLGRIAAAALGLMAAVWIVHLPLSGRVNPAVEMILEAVLLAGYYVFYFRGVWKRDRPRRAVEDGS